MYALGDGGLWYTPEGSQDALCRYQACGTSLCPCAPGMAPGTIPGVIAPPPPQPQPTILPDLTTSASPIPFWLIGIGVLGILAAIARSRRGGRRLNW